MRGEARVVQEEVRFGAKSFHVCGSCKKEEGKRLRLQVQGDLR